MTDAGGMSEGTSFVQTRHLRRRLLAGLVIPLLVGPMVSTSVRAAPRDQVQAVEFNIQPGSLDAALLAFAAQSGRQLVYSPDLVAGLQSTGLKGRLSPDEAIEKLLAGAPIEIRRGGANAFVLKRRPTPAAFAAPTSDTFSQGGLEPVAAPSDPTELTAIVVTGSLIRGAGDGPSPVVTLDRDAIDRGGHATLAEALSALPQNFGGGSTPANQLLGADRSFTNDSVATGVNLRGLGSSATLVLLNGRRVAGTGLKGNFADVSAIPTGAIERVEVLLDGASALYGSDAVGGVVNVILRQNFEGAETRARTSIAQGGTARELQFAQTFGKGWGSGHAVISAEYYQRDPLAAAERDFTASSDLRAQGGTDHRTYFAHPGNVVAYSAAAGGYVPLYAIPAGQNGVGLKPSDFQAGVVNLGDSRQGSDTLPKQERGSLYASLRQDIGRTELSAEALYTHRRFSYRQGGATTILTVRQANPFFVSPNGATSNLIGYDFTDELGARRLTGTAENLGVTLGAARDFGRTWRAEVYGTYAIDRGTRLQGNYLNSRFLSEALGNIADDPATNYSASRDGYFNPYGAAGANSKAVLDFINSGYLNHWRRNRVTSASLKVDGTVFELPGGPVKLAAGAQVRDEDFIVRNTNLSSRATPTVTDGQLFERSVRAAFAELRVPLVGPDQQVPGVRRLELSLAGRIERYSDFGTTKNPKIGAVWEPARGVKLRASYGASFRAPTLADIHESYAVGAAFVPDKAGQTLILLQTGGNPDLGPETAKTWTAGIDLTLPQRRGSRLSVTWFDTRFANQVGHPVYDDIVNALNNPIYASFIRRLNPTNAKDLADAQTLIDDPTSADAKLFPADAFGAIIDGRNRNAGELDVRGLDVDVAWPLTIGADPVTLTTNLSYLLDYRRQLTVDAPSVQFVDLAGFPIDLRANVGASWSHGPFTTALTVRYVDDYKTSAGVKIAAWTTADLQVLWTSPQTRGPLAGLVVAASVHNLLAKDPPFYDAVQGVGYDPANADAIGRVMALQFKKRW